MSFAEHDCTMLGTKAMIVSRHQQPGLGLLPSFGLFVRNNYLIDGSTEHILPVFGPNCRNKYMLTGSFGSINIEILEGFCQK